MKQVIYAPFVLILVILCCATVGMAQVEETAIGGTFGVGARTMGMGGASLGLSDDFTALYWNPAGLAQIQKFEFFSSFSHNTAATDTFFTGDADKVSTTHSHLRPNSIGFVYPFPAKRGGWAIAFGYNRHQNFDYQTTIQGLDPSTGTEFSGLAVDETNIDRGGIGLWSVGTSVYVSKYLLIGGSLDFWQGGSLYQLDTTATDLLNVDSDLSEFRYEDEIDRSYSAIGGRIGVLANLTERVSIGVNFVAPMELGVDERWYQYTEAAYDDGERTSDSASGKQSFAIERPFQIGAGVAVKLFNKQLILAGDIQYTDWTQTRYTSAPAEDISHDNFEKYYSAPLQVRIGAEYRIPVIATHIRLGYFRDPFPYVEKESDDTRDYLTAGIGKIFEDSLKFDIGYTLGGWWWTKNELTTEWLAHRIFVSAAYRF